MRFRKKSYEEISFIGYTFLPNPGKYNCCLRPSQNNQRYAFTPLLDDSEDDNDADDLLYSHDQSGVYTELKSRNLTKGMLNNKPDKHSNIAVFIRFLNIIIQLFTIFRKNSTGSNKTCQPHLPKH